MITNFYALTFQTCTIGLGTGLTIVVSDNHCTREQTYLVELRTKSQHVLIIGDAQIAAHLVFFNVACTDNLYDFRIIGQLHQHAQFAVGMKAGQYSTCMIVIKQFSAKFQIKLIAKTSDALLDVFRLNGKVFIVVETVFHKKEL